MPISAEIAPALGGATDWSKIHVIDLELLPEQFRLQRLIFVAARKAYGQMQETFSGGREYLVYQLIRLVEAFIDSDKRSEEHTSELQSLMRISYAVFCLKKKNKDKNNTTIDL